MNESLIVTVIGTDRPGIVARLAGVAGACGASWQESRLARLAGQFAGIVHLAVPAQSMNALERSLAQLEAEGLRLTFERSTAVSGEPQPHMLEVVGQDRPGIVRDISAVLLEHRASIDELDTEIESASMSGEQLFRAQARLVLPRDADLDALRGDLEALTDELVVELTFDGTGGGRASPSDRGRQESESR